MLPENYYLYGLSRLPGLGSVRIQELLAHFEFSPSLVWQAIIESDLPCSADFSKSLLSSAKSMSLDHNWYELNHADYHYCSMLDDDYPALLKQISDPPVFLFYKGVLRSEIPITVVGSRRMSAYGQHVLESFFSELRGKPINIVSGLAYGVDREAHELAMQYGLQTTAVLGSGLHHIQPAQHELLAQRIIDEQGCVLTEFEADIRAQKGTFPRRNRLLAGLSNMTIVIEAAIKSGALITARFASEYNREVAAIPGSIFSEVSEGCHALLKQGAIPITASMDILKILDLPSQNLQLLPEILSEKEKNILHLVGDEGRTIDELAKTYSGRSADLFSVISSLELKKLIRHYPGIGYKATKRPYA